MSDVVLGYTEELKKNRDKVTVRIRRRTRRTNILTPNTVVLGLKCPNVLPAKTLEGRTGAMVYTEPVWSAARASGE